MPGIFETSRCHLDSVGESYWGHQRFATKIGLTMIRAGAAALIHGVAPFLFESTASRAIKQLAALIENRSWPATLAARTERNGSRSANPYPPAQR